MKTTTITRQQIITWQTLMWSQTATVKLRKSPMNTRDRETRTIARRAQTEAIVTRRKIDREWIIYRTKWFIIIITTRMIWAPSWSMPICFRRHSKRPNYQALRCQLYPSQIQTPFHNSTRQFDRFLLISNSFISVFSFLFF
jgi:hypothetical protein